MPFECSSEFTEIVKRMISKIEKMLIYRSDNVLASNGSTDPTHLVNNI